jgi:hypothetical protein
MLARIRERLTYANVVATLGLFIALGGSSVAAVSLKRNAVKGKHIAKNAVTAPKVKDQSLLAQDFAPGQLPQGEKGETGEPGRQGERGPQGPGAARIAYRVVPTSAHSSRAEVAGVGPWKVFAECATGGGLVVLDVFVSGPGTVEWAGMKAVNDISPAPSTGGIGLSAGDNLVARAQGTGNYERIAYDMQLESGPNTATLSFNGVANASETPNCTLRGTAVPAG